MYKSFFGLQKNPFNINPDPAYLCLTPQLAESLAELKHGLQARKGLMVLTGEAGTGKTTLVNHLLQWLQHQKARTAFIFNSHLDSAQLFDFILSDFEIPASPLMTANPLLAFNEWLLQRYRAHELVVLIVDEAQGLPRQVLEQIRLLSNMETPHEKLLQILLVGQPELEAKLRRPDLRQVQQRIELRCKTSPLTLKETQTYIESRLHTAGSRNPTSIFSPDAIEAVHDYARGIPRVLNLLCENALMFAFAERQSRIHAPLVLEAARQLQFDDFKPLAPRVAMFPQPPASSVPLDLRTILDRHPDEAIHAAEDDRRKAEAAFSSLPGLHGAGSKVAHRALPLSARAAVPASGPRREALLTSAAGELNPGALAENLADTSAKTEATPVSFSRAAHHRGWKRELSGGLLRSILADVRFASNSAGRFVADLRMPEKLRGAARAVRSTPWPAYRSTAKAHAASLWINLQSKVLSGATGMRHYANEQAIRVQKRWWWRQNSLQDLYAETFAATAVVSALMYLVARRVYPAQSWHHPALLVLAFALFLISALAGAFAVRVLVIAHGQLRGDLLNLFRAAVRWLRSPIALHMRPVVPSGHKLPNQR